MVSGQLPIIKIDGIEYVMDARLKEYRRIPSEKRPKGLAIKKFNEVSESNKVELVQPRQMIKDSEVITCLTMKEYDELYDIGIKEKVLKRIPICEND